MTAPASQTVRGQTRLTEYLSQTLYVAIIDYGPPGVGSGEVTHDPNKAQDDYDAARGNNRDAVVWVIKDNVQTDVTDIFEAKYQEWLDARPRTDAWGNDREEKDDRP